MTDLIERLEAGETGPVIDAEIFRHFGWTVRLLPGPAERFVAYPPEGGPANPVRQALSTHIDAAVALVERVFPGAVWHASSRHLDDPAWAMLNPAGWDAHMEAKAPTPAAALVAALLKAERGE